MITQHGSYVFNEYLKNISVKESLCYVVFYDVTGLQI